MRGPILQLDDLRAITGYQRQSDIERCLREQGVRIFWGRLGPWTTVDLVNAAGGLKAANGTDGQDAYPSDLVA